MGSRWHSGEKIFIELIKYTQPRFEYDEAHLRSINYPDYPRHKENHDRLVKWLDNYADRFKSRDQGVQQRTMSFIKTWLDGHILDTDRQHKRTAAWHARQRNLERQGRPLV
ncbi:MAG: hypothetical protein OEZ10_05960 [Gammaproteobacteria bacterium]|nr:hypothetical protein [Gammaproteobacteria bacterium]